MNASIDTKNHTISINDTIVFTAPVGWSPYPQILGEINEMEDAGTIDRTTARALRSALNESDIGTGHRRTVAWQFGGAL